MEAPYLILPLGILSTLLYLISLALVRLHVWSRTSHRKLWNVILLLVFLSTAILGLLLAIQINYKLEWKVVDALLKWHVDIGIALSFVGTFHFLWNFSYYVNLFKRKKKAEEQSVPDQPGTVTDKKQMRILIILSGFVSTVIQVLLIREITTVFQGNEFMMGWTLGIWMLLTGTGSWLGRSIKLSKVSTRLFRSVIISVATVAPAITILLNLLKNIIFLPGVLISPLSFLLICFLVLLPVCLLTGILFSLFVRHYSGDKKNFISVYALEATGSMAGGIIVSFLFVNWLTILQSQLILLFVILFIVYLLSGSNLNIVLLSFAILINLAFFIFPFENFIRSGLFLHRNILENKETYYGNITVTENSGEYNFFSNGTLLFSSDNFILREEYTHYALMQRDDPEKVLIVSGAIQGIAAEVLKYSSIKQVDCIEINPKLMDLGEKYNLLPEDPRVNIIYADALRYLTSTHEKYNAVIMAVPDPSSLQVNRYYSDEFLDVLKDHLKNDAVVLYGISSTGNYMSDEQANKLTVLMNTLKKHFRETAILPGEKDYLLASDKSLSLSVSSLDSTIIAENIYVNPDYIDDESVQLRSEFIRGNLPENQQFNTNNHPLPVFFDTLHFISRFYNRQKGFIFFPLLMLVLPLFFMKPVTTGMYTAGFTGASIEILLILAFQVIYGYVYAAIGIIVALFMAGLAAGSILGYKLKITKMHLPLLQAFLILYLVLLPFALKLLGQHDNSVATWPVFILLTFIPSAAIGYFFVVTTILHSPEASGSAPLIYATDLIGSAIGVIVSTILLVPLLGVNTTCYLLAGFNFCVGVYYLVRKR